MMRRNNTAGTFRKERIKPDKTKLSNSKSKIYKNQNSIINNEEILPKAKELSFDDINIIRNTLVELGISPYIYKGNKDKHSQLNPTPLSKYIENNVENGWVSPIDINDKKNEIFNSPISNIHINNNNNNNNNHESTPNYRKPTTNVDSSLFTPSPISFQSNSNNIANQINGNTVHLTPTPSIYDPSLFIPSPTTAINYQMIMHYKSIFDSVNDSNNINDSTNTLTNINIDNISNCNRNEDERNCEKGIMNMRKIEYDMEEEGEVIIDNGNNNNLIANIIYPDNDFITNYCYYYDNNDNLKILPTEIIQKIYLSHLEYESKLKRKREETIKAFQISLTNKTNIELEEFENKLMKNKFMNINKNSKSYKYIEKVDEQQVEAVAYGIIYEAIALFAHPSSSSSSSSNSLVNKKINNKSSSFKSNNNNNSLNNDIKKLYKSQLNDAAKTRISNKIIKYKSYVLNSLEENIMLVASNKLATIMKDINLKQEICIKQLQNDINLINSTKLADYEKELNIKRFNKIKKELELYQDIEFNNLISDDESINIFVNDLIKHSQGIENVGNNNSKEIFLVAAKRRDRNIINIISQILDDIYNSTTSKLLKDNYLYEIISIDPCIIYSAFPDHTDAKIKSQYIYDIIAILLKILNLSKTSLAQEIDLYNMYKTK